MSSYNTYIDVLNNQELQDTLLHYASMGMVDNMLARKAKMRPHEWDDFIAMADSGNLPDAEEFVANLFEAMADGLFKVLEDTPRKDKYNLIKESMRQVEQKTGKNAQSEVRNATIRHSRDV